MSFDNMKKVNSLNINNKPSLLSTSLANQRLVEQEKPPVDEEIYEDHPEPELLATSVDGKLIPSSSSISLFSLNQAQEYSPKMEGVPSGLSGLSGLILIQQSQTPSQTPSHLPTQSQLQQQLQQQSQLQSQSQLQQQLQAQTQTQSQLQAQLQSQPQPQSFTSPQLVQGELRRGRNSVSSLNQKRYENYRLTSPPIQDPVVAIPINNKNLNVPDSPNLDPTSLTGSPSRFWLSSQTPPKLLNNSYKRLSGLSEYQKNQLNHQLSNLQLQQIQSVQPMRIPKDVRDSPILNPQTPNEDQPMTPLYLNNNYLTSNYFAVNAHIDEEDEEMV